MKPGELERARAGCRRHLAGHGPRTAAELLAGIPTDLGIDRYGEGGAVAALEDEVRKVLRKPAAASFPSGTMAQQAALRIHADRRGLRAIAFHPTCAFMKAVLRIARERSVFTWPGSMPGATPATRIVELTVGDATLAIEPREAASIIAELVR